MRGQVFVVVFLLAASALALAKEETLDQLKERAAKASGKEQAKLFLEVAQRQLVTANAAYEAGDLERAQAAIDEVADFSEKAGTAAIASRKHMKQVEIKVRDMEHKLSDIRRTVNFDDRPPLEAAIERMEKIRASLLKAMFGPNS